MDRFDFQPIAHVENGRDELDDDNWGNVISRIHLREDLSQELFQGLEEFSHVEVIYVFHRLAKRTELPPLRHPRNNKTYPEMGLLAQRSTKHPNPLGLCSAEILALEGRVLKVKGLDAVNGTPILDIKPVFKEFTARKIKQPTWVSDLLKDYWIKE